VTLVLGSPQMSTHLRVAQTSGTEASGPGTGAGEGTQAGRSQLAKGRGPKKWPVQHSKGQKGGSRQQRRSRTTPVGDDGNADLCAECGMGGGGGVLYCSDVCPRVWHGACLESKGVPAPSVSGEWRGPCCSAQSSSVSAEGPRTSRERLGRKSADGTTPEHTQHQVQEGESGTEARYRYTNKKSERSPYIAERAKLAHNLTEREILQLQYQNRARGHCSVPEERPAVRHPAGILADNQRWSGRGGEGTARKAHRDRHTAKRRGEGQEQE
jgi:hypothetical protein